MATDAAARRAVAGWAGSAEAAEPLVGRGDLLDHVDTLLRRGGRVWLHGPTGIGKTRLLQALATSPPSGVRPVLIDDLDDPPSQRWTTGGYPAAPGRPMVVAAVQPPAAGGGWSPVAVPGLSRLATGELIRSLLGDAIDPQLASEVWRAGGGHPGATRALVLDAKETGSLKLGCDGWELCAELPLRRLTELVAARLAGLSAPARQAAEHLAFGSPMPVGVAARLLAPTALRELERSALVRLPTSEGPDEVALAEPLHGEVLRASLPADTRRARLRELAATFEQAVDVDSDDQALVRIGRWRLEVGGWSPSRYARVAVAASRVDEPGLARRAASRVVAAGGRAPRLSLLAAGSLEAAAGRIALRAARRGRVHAADAALTGNADVSADGAAVLAAGAVALDRLDPSGLTRARTAAASGNDLRHHLARRLLEAATTLADTATPLTDRLLRSRSELEAALARDGGGRALWLGVHGLLLARAGDLRQAHEMLVAAVQAAERRDPWRLRGWLVAGVAEVAAASGATIEAEHRLAGIADVRAAVPRVDTQAALAEAMIAAQRDGEPAGRQLAVAAGDDAAADGRTRDALEGWWLAVRLGASEGLLERLDRAQLPADHPLVRVVRRQAAAVASRDADALDAVARELAADGRALVAAEAAARASHWSDDPRSAALASGLLVHCRGAATPITDGHPVSELSARRREVAALVVAGLDGRSIAERLGVSTRTVENHLTGVYRQLGVRSRRELSELYGPAVRWRAVD